MPHKLTEEDKKAVKLRVKAAKAEEKKQRKAERKLRKIQKKSAKKLRKIEKKFEKVQIKSDTKAKKYVPPETELPDKQKPRVGDPVLLNAPVSEEQVKKPKKTDPKEEQKARERSERREQKLRLEKEKLERKRIASGDLTMYERFDRIRFEELEEHFMKATTRDERAFYRALLNLKLQIEQEKVIGEVLL